MTGFRLAEVGRLGQAVDPLHGGDVDPLTGSLLSVAQIRDILADRHSTPPVSARRPEVMHGSVRRLGVTRREPAAPSPTQQDPISLAPSTAHTDDDVQVPPSGLWVMGVSGGCGESTVAAFLPDAVAGQRQWPPTETPGRAVLMVARGSMTSLAAAQRIAGEWAAGGAAGARLLGLLVVADAPGGEPRPVTDLVRLLAGGVPQVWRLPWVRDWRLASPQEGPLPRPAAAVARAITAFYR